MTKENSNGRQASSFPSSEFDSPIANEKLILLRDGLFREDVETGSEWVHSHGKRVFDVTVALFGIVSTLPLLLLIALVIKVTSPGPVLFRQRRVGKGQVPFTIYKYRTMHTFSDLWGPRITRTSDCRLTAFGCLLRKLKLDELPQLFNVVRGDMSLVGPRPKLAEHERMEMICRPGITGAATLIFAREEELLNQVPEESFEHFTVEILNNIKAALDREHAESSTFFSDLRIIAETAVTSRSKKPVTSLEELYERYGGEVWDGATLANVPIYSETRKPIERTHPQPSDAEAVFAGIAPLSTYVSGDNTATAPY